MLSINPKDCNVCFMRKYRHVLWNETMNNFFFTILIQINYIHLALFIKTFSAEIFFHAVLGLTSLIWPWLSTCFVQVVMPCPLDLVEYMLTADIHQLSIILPNHSSHHTSCHWPATHSLHHSNGWVEGSTSLTSLLLVDITGLAQNYVTQVC